MDNPIEVVEEVTGTIAESNLSDHLLIIIAILLFMIWLQRK